MKTEDWNGYKIRFVWKNGEWWAVLKDVCEALGLTPKFVRQRLDDEVVSNNPIVDRLGREQEALIVNEYGIYDTVFQSRKPEAKAFRRWVYEMLKTLREASGLEGFEIFLMLDKEHQKETMQELKNKLSCASKVDYIKANTIANKAVSNMHGYPKMIKKSEMNPQMLIDREPILEDTVRLMELNEQFDLNLSVSKLVYRKYS